MRKSDQAKIAGDVFSAISTLSFMSGLGVIGYQLAMWYKYGGWIPLRFEVLYEDLFGRLPHISWIAALRVIDWIFDLPMAIVVMMIGILTLVLSTRFQYIAYRLFVIEEKGRGWR